MKSKVEYFKTMQEKINQLRMLSPVSTLTKLLSPGNKNSAATAQIRLYFCAYWNRRADAHAQFVETLRQVPINTVGQCH